MAFDFDQVIDRRGTHSYKWDSLATRMGPDAAADAVSMWVADMDFAAPPAVRARLAAQVEHGVFGYYGDDSTWRAAICGWAARRHGWEIDPDWISLSAGVCAGFAIAIRAVSEPGEGVVVFPPVYHSFASGIKATGRRVIDAPLREEQGRYRMDLDALGASLPNDARAVLFSNPHNPGGTVWSAEEIAALAAFCAERDLVLISDEIWRDLVFSGARFTTAALAAPEHLDRMVLCTAPSKTFNLAGGSTSEIIIPNATLRARYRAVAKRSHSQDGNLFGLLAAEAAYAEGDAWLDAVLLYLESNRDRFNAALAEAAPGARPMALESTYLSWVNFAGTGLAPAEVHRRIKEVARISVNPGPSFGAGGETCARFNFACPRATLDTALNRLADAFADLR